LPERISTASRFRERERSLAAKISMALQVQS
jgi:hypothetical protein